MVKGKIWTLVAAGLLVVGLLGMFWQRQEHLSEDQEVLFQRFSQRYEKYYISFAEQQLRFQLFQQASEVIAQHNRHQSAFSLAINAFADLSAAEFAESYLGSKVPSRSQFVTLPIDDLPCTVDWTQTGGVSPVLNQGMCAADWAYAAAGAIEGLQWVRNSTMQQLSVQQLIDCSHAYGNEGCLSGTLENAYRYVIASGGLESLRNYPLRLFAGFCLSNSNKFTAAMQNYTYVFPYNELQLKAAVSHQPVAALVEADQPAFMYYHSGVITYGCGARVNHAVLVVGYGEEEGVPYWLVKNSWGENWGEFGFVKIYREDANNNKPGMCGIAVSPSYPV